MGFQPLYNYGRAKKHSRVGLTVWNSLLQARPPQTWWMSNSRQSVRAGPMLGFHLAALGSHSQAAPSAWLEQASFLLFHPPVSLPESAEFPA